MAMGTLMKSGAFALAELNFASGTSDNLGYLVREGVTGGAQLKLRTRLENVSGVQLPMFEMQQEGSSVNGNHTKEYFCY